MKGNEIINERVAEGTAEAYLNEKIMKTYIAIKTLNPLMPNEMAESMARGIVADALKAIAKIDF
jgi:hypothetical protein